MGKHLTYNDTKKQSLQVFGQFGESVWIPNAKENSKLERKESSSLQNAGIGKVLVMVAMGASLEENVEHIIKYRDRFDLMCCDKAFVPLMERGIRPDYVMICDANIPSRFYETHVLKTKGIKLIATPYANTMWTKPWIGDRYFYVNKDAISSEDVFLDIFGQDTRVIPASSNVSNAMCVFMLGADERKRINWAGYEKYLLVGYDYSWSPKGNYYAWNDPVPKRYYMQHQTRIDMNGNTVFTSSNLAFSVQWLKDYLTYHSLPVINCSRRGILKIPLNDSLENQLKKINPDKSVIDRVRSAYQLLQSATVTKINSQNIFEKSREDILWQSEAMQK